MSFSPGTDFRCEQILLLWFLQGRMRMKTAFAVAAFQVKWGLDKINLALFCEADILVNEFTGWTET